MTMNGKSSTSNNTLPGMVRRFMQGEPVLLRQVGSLTESWPSLFLVQPKILWPGQNSKSVEYVMFTFG